MCIPVKLMEGNFVGLSDLMCIPVKLMEGNLVGNFEDFLVGN